MTRPSRTHRLRTLVARSPLRAAGALLVGAYLAILATLAVKDAAGRLHDAEDRWGDGFRTSRARLLGRYGEGLAEVESLIPRDAAYLLLNRGTDGGFMLLQGDLAPRRPLILPDQNRRLPTEWLEEGVPPEVPRDVIRFEGLDRPPRYFHLDEVVR
ncbi:MAG TPA: hypothetical protein VMT16_07095 [Thermoanaerobaculia bacterium]|nr:hypothetical protein [Thermoanaerobaculia bacterium]